MLKPWTDPTPRSPDCHRTHGLLHGVTTLDFRPYSTLEASDPADAQPWMMTGRTLQKPR
jgi:hypothetical protein